MNCEDMMNIPELKDVLALRAGADGIGHAIRWIYFADTLECVKSEYRVENYIHGGEFVVLTSRNVTDDADRLLSVIRQICKIPIAALGINEGQIPDRLIAYCDAHALPLFELPEKFPLVDLSQILCQRLVLEENSRNSAEQLLSSIIDAEHLNHENVYAQARFLNIDLEGDFCVAEFAFSQSASAATSASGGSSDAVVTWMGDSLSLGRAVRRIITSEFSYRLPQNILTRLQTGSVLALIPSGRLSPELFRDTLAQIVHRVQEDCHMEVTVGVGEAVSYLEEVRRSRDEAAAAIRIAAAADTGERIVFYREQGLYTLLSHITDGKFLDDFADKQIGKLLYADAVNDSHLCETLESYLAHNCNVKNTAEALYIHRNTMNYRLHRIREILGKSFEDLDTCLLLRLAFAIRKLRPRA